MFYQYGYFIGCLIVFAVWLVIFIYRKDLRKEMLFASIITIPFGMTEFLYVPEYWNPPSLFNFIQKYGFGIESIFFAFVAGGLASVFYQVIAGQKTVKILFDRRIHALPYFFIVLLYFALEFIFPSKTIYNAIFSLFVGAILIGYLRRDLIRQIIFSSTYFAVLYFILFFIFLQIFPQYVTKIYNLKNFIGVDIFGVPIEEIMFAFVLGACWSSFYEYIRGYRTKPL
jgi:hypothetical protein